MFSLKSRISIFKCLVLFCPSLLTPRNTSTSNGLQPTSDELAICNVQCALELSIAFFQP